MFSVWFSNNKETSQYDNTDRTNGHKDINWKKLYQKKYYGIT